MFALWFDTGRSEFLLVLIQACLQLQLDWLEFSGFGKEGMFEVMQASRLVFVTQV